jgi:hypothetical protein
VSPLERTLAEAQPDGTFGGPRTPATPWTPDEQARHYADLEAALNGWEWDRPTRRQASRQRKASR